MSPLVHWLHVNHCARLLAWLVFSPRSPPWPVLGSRDWRILDPVGSVGRREFIRVTHTPRCRQTAICLDSNSTQRGVAARVSNRIPCQLSNEVFHPFRYLSSRRDCPILFHPHRSCVHHSYRAKGVQPALLKTVRRTPREMMHLSATILQREYQGRDKC
ncbi:hypothetical protein BD779DRAFT_1035618 [Infundibulicybe gibba]|nr:hypothetical protein BD779DRAFT_1035618 [Infundibulicybe gibba]